LYGVSPPAGVSADIPGPRLQLAPEKQAMSHTNSNRSAARKIALLAVWPAALLLTGCQVEMAGQTLPSPYYLTDDIQYYAPAPSEFKLSREAAAIQEQNEAIESQRQEALAP
jgi:hypothetical protein